MTDKIASPQSDTKHASTSKAKYYIVAAVAFLLVVGSTFIYYLVARSASVPPNENGHQNGSSPFLLAPKTTSAYAHKQIGLENSGNSCFLNAIIQVLYHDDAFRSGLDQLIRNYPEYGDQDHLTRLRAYRDFFAAMDKTANGATLKPALETLMPAELATGRQEDAHQALMSVLGGFNWPNLSFTVDTRFKEIYSKDVFMEDNRTEEHLPIVINIPRDPKNEGKLSLQALMDEQLLLTDSEAPLGQINRANGVQKIEIHREKFNAPPTLIVQVARFYHDDREVKKILTPVDIPESLQIRSEQSGQIASYKLYSFVLHSGQKAGYGHYRAYVKQDDGTYTHYNDCDITTNLTPSHIKEERETAYLYIYHLENGQK